MTFEKPPITPYRERLAEELRKESDHSKRKVILRDAKLTSEYFQNSGDFEQKTYQSEQVFKKVLDLATGVDELKSLLAKENLSLPNGHRGGDHGEHIIKRIDMAQQLGLMELIPDVQNTREIVGRLFEKEASAGKGITYQEFLLNRFEYLSFTKNELEILQQKITPEIFASVDTSMENVVVQLNVLSGVKTSYSCSGHGKLEGNPPSIPYLNVVFDDGVNEDIKRAVIAILRKNRYGYKVTSHIFDDNKIVFYYDSSMSEEEREEQGLPSDEEIFEESKKRIAEITRYEELLSKTNKEHYFEDVLEAQKFYLQNDVRAATIPFAHNSMLLSNINKAFVSSLKSEIYSDFNYSDEMFEKRDQLMVSISDDLLLLRRQII